MKKILFGLTVLTLALGSAQAAKITVWTHYGPEDLAWLNAAAKSFTNTAAGKGNTVEVVVVPFADIKQKMIQSKGEAADVVVSLPQDQIGELITNGVLEPVDALISKKAKDDLAKSSQNAFTYNGKLFGFPVYNEAVAVVYNKKLLPGGIPKTWPEFIATAQKLTDASQQKFGFLAEIENQYNMHGIFYAFGGYVFKGYDKGAPDQKDVGLANAGADKAGQLINDLRYKYNLIPEGAADGGVIADLFYKGQVAMWQTGPWNGRAIRNSGVDFGVGVLPKPTGAVRNWAPFLGVQAIVLNSYSNQKKLAADFANFLVSSENQVALSKAGGKIPASKAASRKLAGDPVIIGFSKAAQAGVAMPNIAAMGQVWGPWGDAVTLIAKTKGANVSKLLDDAVKQINANIK